MGQVTATTCVILIGVLARMRVQVKTFGGGFRDATKQLECVTATAQLLVRKGLAKVEQLQ